MNAACIALLAALPGPFTASPGADGDNLRLGGCNTRIHGIAAPEIHGEVEPGGREAAAMLWAFVEGEPLLLELIEVDRYDRPVIRAWLPRSVDVAAAMVLSGFALDCPAYSDGAYADFERQAVEAGRDLGAIYALPGYCEGDG